MLPTPCHNLALDLGQPKQGKGQDQGCIWTEPQTPSQAAHQTSVSTQTSSTSPLPFFGAKPQWEEKEKHTLKGKRASLNLTLRASAPATGEQTLPLTGQRQPRVERKSCLIPYTCFNPSNTNDTTYQGDSAQHSLRKDVTGVQIISSPCTKYIGNTQST